MTEPIYGIAAAVECFAAAGATMNRITFMRHILPEFKRFGFAEKHGTLWIFDRRYLQHWIEYVAEVQSRKADGRISRNYSLSEGDMQNFIDGSWDVTGAIPASDVAN